MMIKQSKLHNHLTCHLARVLSHIFYIIGFTRGASRASSGVAVSVGVVRRDGRGVCKVGSRRQTGLG